MSKSGKGRGTYVIGKGNRLGKTSKTKEFGIFEGLEKHSEQLHMRENGGNEAGGGGGGEIMKSLLNSVQKFGFVPRRMGNH